MTFRLSLKLGNPAASNVSVLIEEGTIFEVRDITQDPPQTLRVLQPAQFELAPGEVKFVDLDTECLNVDHRAPDNDPMQLTPFIL